MKFHFDPNLDYQVNAIQAVVRLFEGAPLPATDALGSPDFSIEMETGTGMIGTGFAWCGRRRER
jgi:restriction endonuclease